MKRRVTALVAALACGALGACASTSDVATKASLAALKSSPTTTTATTTPPPPPPGCNGPQDAVKSLRPTGPLPTPGEMPVGTFMYDVQTRPNKTLKVGVDENTLLLSSRDPKTGVIDGLEIDIVRAIAAAIGPDVNVDPRPVVTENKTNVVKMGDVDMTISAVSMTCSRLNDVLFSSEYFTTDQKLLVRDNSMIQHAADLAGKTVCMTTGSSSIGVLKDVLDKLHVAARDPLLVPARTDCLVALQDGTADAYFGHETFLYGMALQDPTMRMVDESQSVQHYGIAIAQAHPDFVRFVNAVLERMRADGTLAGIYDKWLANRYPAVPLVPPVPAAQYKD